MQSWKTPALLGLMGLTGLGSLNAQAPSLPAPTFAEPTPLDAPQPPAPAAAEITSTTPIELVTPPVPVAEPENRNIETVPSPLIIQEPFAPGNSEMNASSATNAVGEMLTPGIPQPTYVVAPAPQVGCGCHGSGFSEGMNAIPMEGIYGPTQGTGSGVASGRLTPNSNSGGLHTRYPYYNYRHPWFYQGPPSQNVTIVW